MCTILRKDIWSYWTVLTAWLKLITWCHWQLHVTLLDSFTWCYLVLLDRITWRYWTVSPGVAEPHHLILLDSFTWRYWIVSADVTGQFHLSLLNLPDSFTQWATETYHLTLQDSNRAVQYATTNSLICDCFLKWSLSNDKFSISCKCNVKPLHHGLHHSPFITFLNFRESWLIFKYRIL